MMVIMKIEVEKLYRLRNLFAWLKYSSGIYLTVNQINC